MGTRTRSFRRTLWAVLTAALLLVAGLTVASAAEYSSVVVAKATVYIVPRYSVEYAGLESDGTLSANGSVTVITDILVENPSSRTIRLSLIAYTSWIEDGPAQAGLNESRRINDDVLLGPTGVRYFYRAFLEDSEIITEPVPAGGNRSFRFAYALLRATNPTRFQVVDNITAYLVSRGGSVASASWNHYLRTQLTIDGVPRAEAPGAAAYLRELNRIDREVGVNLAP